MSPLVVITISYRYRRIDGVSISPLQRHVYYDNMIIVHVCRYLCTVNEAGAFIIVTCHMRLAATSALGLDRIAPL